mmetsp:Transcript_67042/g.209747  ORF Transcript_67042/g.209747 Transcript_67042/m.209747 type:complete len:101 (-) Transcript_67042:446-748(-)
MKTGALGSRAAGGDSLHLKPVAGLEAQNLSRIARSMSTPALEVADVECAGVGSTRGKDEAQVEEGVEHGDVDEEGEGEEPVKDVEGEGRLTPCLARPARR